MDTLKNPCLDYRDRITHAERCLDLPVSAWPTDVRELFQTVLETWGEMVCGAPQRAMVRNIGMKTIPRAPQSIEFGAIVDALADVGLLGNLILCGSRIWRT